MEAVVLVCDLCGKPAVETVRFRVRERNLEKDYCAAHLAELEAGARRPRRGRQSATRVAATPATRRGRPPGSKNAVKSGNGRRRRRTAETQPPAS